MVRKGKIALPVILLLFYAVVPDFAAAQAQQFQTNQQTELRLTLSADMARPDRYKIDISKRNISSWLAADQGGQPWCLAAIDQGGDSRDSIDVVLRGMRYIYKSPTVTFLLAFFPGFCIHGLGHAYIGKGNTALVLFGIQVISIALTLAAIGYRQKRMDEGFRVDDAAAEPWFFAALALFFGSWMYDFTAAPDKAHRMNEQARKSSASRPALSIGAGIKNNQTRLAVTLRW